LSSLQLGALLEYFKRGPGMALACAPENKLKKYLDKIEAMDYIKNMKQELVERYYDYYDRLKKGELTIQQWNDLCLLLLQEIMEENKDVFIRLKNR
jgi:hypothetical protein